MSYDRFLLDMGHIIGPMLTLIVMCNCPGCILNVCFVGSATYMPGGIHGMHEPPLQSKKSNFV
jgi:hypothetical protein